MDRFRYTEVTRNSWGSRLGNSVGGVVFGLVLFIASMPLLWWNEGRSVDRITTLDTGLGLVQSIAASEVSPARDGALVHLVGLAEGNEILTDPLFGVAVEALKLRRVVQMYQWVEDVEERRVQETGGSERIERTYSYRTEWRDDLVDSRQFYRPSNHENPAQMPFETRGVWVDRVSVGAFTLGEAFIDQLQNFEEYTITPEEAEAADPMVRDRYRLIGGRMINGDPTAPDVGDVRVLFRVVNAQEVSLVGQQQGDRLERFHTATGEIALLEYGRMPPEAMFSAAQAENTLITWLIRLGGFIAMWVGLALLFGPIRMLAAVLPFLGNLVGAGIGLITGVVAVLLSGVLISMAWMFYRPVIGLSVLAVVAVLTLGGGWLAERRGRRARAASVGAEG